MGCCFSAPFEEGAPEQQQQPKRGEAPTQKYSKPKWKNEQALSAGRLQAMREEFWDTQPHYGGDRVIWDAIKAACEAEDMATTRLILETAGVIVAKPDLTVMYDERGVRYALPKYVLSIPTNLVKEEVQLTRPQQQQRA